MKTSIIVPIAPGESLLDGLAAELGSLPDEFEVLLVSSAEPQRRIEGCSWMLAPEPGRAAALNEGARKAEGDWLWFVHADSRGLAGLVPMLRRAQVEHPQALLYFDLDYYDGGLLHRLSAWGARWRSRLFGAPFGDQAFCLPRELHERVGGYPGEAPYGEDHLYARALRSRNVPLVRLPASVGTSARMHLERGWLRTVVRYQYLWIKQALLDRRPAS